MRAIIFHLALCVGTLLNAQEPVRWKLDRSQVSFVSEAPLERIALAEPADAPLPRNAALATTPTQAAPSRVRSVQRMRLPAGKDAAWAADEYARWLPRALSALIRAEVRSDRSFAFSLLGVTRPMLVLTAAPERSTPDRQLFFVTDGWLVDQASRGRFELRQVLDDRTLLTAIHDFAPSLPWWLYRQTQARFHALVMAAFRRHLGRG